MRSAASPKASLGRYQLVRHLASGGMADVVLARVDGIEGFERHVVVKRIRDEHLADERFVQMFLDEARLAASLHHHNIVQVHELGEEDGEYFFAMEYVHGEDLLKILGHLADKDERLPIDHCVTIGLNVAAALHHAHELRGPAPERRPLGIVHCDVSPANILIGLDGDVKVIDFGIANSLAQTSQTAVEMLKGKAAYMSPEQCLGGVIDRRSDVFCLGIVLYELVTVRRLFKGANDFVTMTQITQGTIPPPSEIRPDLPPEIEAIILRALEYDPADRFQTADELRSALERFAVRAKLQTSATALADTMRAMFGDRVMPWQVEDDEPEISIDFDGDASGVVRAPPPVPPPRPRREEPGSLMARARERARTDDGALGRPVRALGTEPALSPMAAAEAEEAARVAATTRSAASPPPRPGAGGGGAPASARARSVKPASTEELDAVEVLDDAEVPSLAPRRSRAWWAALALVPAAVIAALVLRGGGADEAVSAPPPATTTEPATTTGGDGPAATAGTATAGTATATIATGGTTTAASSTAATGAPADPATATDAGGAAGVPTGAGAGSAAPGADGAEPAPKRPPRRRPPRGVWNPNSLMPPGR